ncbi:MFS transporter [Bradyrhizobium commune]|uniref:MFS transporter n=2 Tax=Bradyrhizobium commune TaxID=83627 RepID=A0A7S9D397_9BRAD|nr:MFS transporter [Bradyrhizobium commune]
MANPASATAVPAEAVGLTKRHAFLVLLCTSAPSFMLQLDANIVSVSLPAIARSLDASFAGIEWVITAYMLSFASLLLPAGALADRFGRKAMLIIGLSVFTVASLLCGSAPNLPVLVAARALQGAGAAMQLSSALATLSHAFQGEARARAFSFWGAVVGIGIACGPIVGGLITQLFGWEWAFYVNLPIGAALIALIVKVVDSSRDPDAVRLDLPGVACFASALFLTTLALIEGNHRGWTDRWILAELGGALVLSALFVAVELRQARPMLDLSYFRRPTYLGANLAQLSFSAGMLTMLTFIPIFLQSGLGHAPALAGSMMLPMVVPLFIVPRIVSRHLAHRLSGRALLSLGLFVVCLGLFWFAAVVRELAYGQMIGGMLLTGTGAGLLNGETTKVGMTVIPRERSGMASGISGTVRFSGLVIGIAALGAVLYGRAAASVGRGLPDASATDRLRLVQEITAGHLAGAPVAGHDAAAIEALSVASFANGYQALFLAGAFFMLVSTILTWRLVSAAETPPVSTPTELRPRHAPG